MQTANDFLTYLCKPTELHFGVSMTVNGKSVGVGPSLRSWESGSWGFKINNEVNFHECASFQKAFAHPTAGDFWNGPYEFGTHGAAITGDGLYFVMEYVAETGDVNMYLSDGKTYVKLYTAEKLFDKNGKLTAFGVSDNVYKTGYENGQDWPDTEGREYTFTLSYGATLNEAIGATVTEYQEEK